MTWTDLTWLDWAIVAVVLFSLLQGLRRGPLTGLLSILGLVCGVVAASVWYPSLADLLTLALHTDKAWTATAAFLAVLAAIYVLIGVAATVLLWVQRMSLPARVLGGLIGGVKGGLLATVLIAVTLASPLGRWVRSDVGRSRLAPHAVQGYQAAVKGLASILPSSIHLLDADKARF